MTVKQLTELHLEVLSLKGFCTGSSESTLVKMPHYWEIGVVVYMQPTIFIGVAPITQLRTSVIK